MNILITGGMGFIGSNLVKKLLEINYPFSQIYIADNLWRGKIENIFKNNKPIISLENQFFNIDLTDYDNCLKVTKNINLVIHLADIVSGINFVFENEPFVFRQNILINSNILKASIQNQVAKILYVGTACSYPAEKQAHLDPVPFVENDAYPANPESSYGWSKLIGEYEIELASKYNLINSCILRLHNVYGPPCEIDPLKSQVIPALCRKIIETKDNHITVWGSGDQRRSFIFIDDVIEGILLALDKGFNEGVIQLGSKKSHSIKEIANNLVKISGKKLNINFDLSQPEGDKDRKANYTKAKEILGWQPFTSFETGLEITYDWVKSYLNK